MLKLALINAAITSVVVFTGGYLLGLRPHGYTYIVVPALAFIISLIFGFGFTSRKD
jgi:hypothetical protein